MEKEGRDRTDWSGKRGKGSKGGRVRNKGEIEGKGGGVRNKGEIEGMIE